MKDYEYNRVAAVNYANTWAYRRNPRYYDFSAIGGDCTNFASQCIYTGAGAMNYQGELGWYYNSVGDRAPAWTSVEYLYKFLLGNQGIGPYAREVGIEEIQPGDIIQLRLGDTGFQHSPIVVNLLGSPNPNNILVAAHTYDTNNRPLNTYLYLEYRCIHIAGVRKW